MSALANPPEVTRRYKPSPDHVACAVKVLLKRPGTKKAIAPTRKPDGRSTTVRPE